MFIVAVTPGVGVLYHEAYQRGVKHEDVRSFLESLSVTLGVECAVLLMDNAPSHRALQDPDEARRVMFLPAHSPFFNAIENCFSILKAHARQRITHMQKEVESRHLAQRHGMLLVEWRSHVLIGRCRRRWPWPLRRWSPSTSGTPTPSSSDAFAASGSRSSAVCSFGETVLP